MASGHDEPVSSKLKSEDGGGTGDSSTASVVLAPSTNLDNSSSSSSSVDVQQPKPNLLPSFSAVADEGEIEQPLLMSLMAILKESEGSQTNTGPRHKVAIRRTNEQRIPRAVHARASADSAPTWPIEGERRRLRLKSAPMTFFGQIPPYNTPASSTTGTNTRTKTDLPSAALSTTAPIAGASTTTDESWAILREGKRDATNASKSATMRITSPSASSSIRSSALFPAAQGGTISLGVKLPSSLSSSSSSIAFDRSSGIKDTTSYLPHASPHSSVADLLKPPEPEALPLSPRESSSPPGIFVEEYASMFDHDAHVQQQIGTMVKLFSSWSDAQKNVLLSRLLRKCRMPQIHFLSSQFTHYGFSSDIVQCLPDELGLKIMSYLDPRGLCRAAQVCRSWRRLADDPRVWRDIVDTECYWRISSDEWAHMEDQALAGNRSVWKTYFSHHHHIKRNWMLGRFAVRTFAGHTAHVSCLQFDDNKIVSGSSDKTIRFWDIRSNTQCRKTLVGHEGTVRCLQFDKFKVVSGSNDATIRVWDINTGDCIAILRGHTSAVRCLQMMGSTLVSGSYDFTIKVWDLDTQRCVRTLSEHTGAVLCVQFDADKIVSGSADSTIKIWDFKTGQCLRTLVDHNDAVTCLQYDGQKIVSGSLDASLKFWSLQTGTCVGTLDWVRSEGHKGVIRNLKFDSWLMISAADDKTIKVWNVQTGQRMLTLQKHAAGVTCLQFSFTKIVSGSYDHTIKVLNFDL